jgi:hypothetical protein
LAYGSLAGIPFLWAVGFVMMLPFGVAHAMAAAIFVGIATGPFAGALVVLVRRLVKVERAAEREGDQLRRGAASSPYRRT